MSREISDSRKAAYYIGLGLMVFGGIIFASTFVVMEFWDFSDFQLQAKFETGVALVGVVLLLVGAITRRIGARGLAGSMVVLDPKRARQDLEPYSRMAGGMLKDALDEAKARLAGDSGGVIRIKCPSCGKLNEEDSRFCQRCGKQLCSEQADVPDSRAADDP
jgi:hypothetical protein